MRPALKTVRLSVTDRCDLACTYCRPSRGEAHATDRLDRAAWRTLVRALISAGVERVRITGGEPLLHPDIAAIVSDIVSAGVRDVALTTNGTRLTPLVADLRRAGLRRITISLDSLDRARFAEITGGGRIERVLDGITTACAAGFDEVKLNTVLMRGVNDDELEVITRWSWARRIVPRFIELMPIGPSANLSRRAMVPTSEAMARLATLLDDADALPEPDRGPAVYRRARHDPGLRAGFISGTTRPFCATCDRLRVGADGALRSCLVSRERVPTIELARSGDVLALARAIDDAWALKPDPATWRGCAGTSAPDVSMRAIGG
jgi:cyclic pyranopterin phosphate synthase